MQEIPPFEEWQTSEVLTLSKKELEFLNQKVNENKTNSKIEIIPKGENQYQLKATSWVGTIKIPNSYTINIRPKIGNLNFFKMLVYSENLADVKFFDLVRASEGIDLVDFMARLFLETTNEIIQDGVYKSYISKVEEIPTIRGRLLLVQNIRRPRITQEKFWCEYDDLSPDILENQILLYSAKLIATLVRDRKLKEEIYRVQYIFEKEGVSDVFLDLYHLDMVTYQKFNQHYENALKLCEFILRLIWYGDFTREEMLPIYGFLYNMNSLFQNFVTRVIQETMPEYRVKREPKKNRLLENVTKFEDYEKLSETVSTKVLKPDIVIQEKTNGNPVFVIDTKYKKGDPSANDFYQSVAYSLSLDCPVLLLLPQLEVRKKGDYELVPELGKQANIFVRTIDFSEKEDLDYIELMKSRIEVEIRTMMP